jgi:4-hydroxy-3-methylbut-2-enyl diphosphate reductase
MININYKSDGIVAKSEASNDDNINLKEAYKVGDEIDVYVLKFDDGEGNVVLSIKRVDDLKVWDDLEEIFKNKETIECKVINVVKGGLIALAKGINAFIPASHVSVNYVSKLDGFKGKNLMVRIIDIDRNKKRIILSRKEVEKEELEVKKAELWENLVVDDIVTGVVQRLTDFGAFVDLGGVDGLIHISDLSWLRVKHPSDVLKVGDKVEVKILALDKEKNRISLGLKQTLEEPWEIFKRNVSEGDTVEGKVVNLLDFGAFIRLKEGVDGLLHVSQISKEHVNKPSDVLKVGDIIKVKVIEINDEDRRISLSTKDESTDDEEVIEETKPEKNDEIIKNEEFDTTVEDIINNNK